MSAKGREWGRFDRVYGGTAKRFPSGPWSSGNGSPWLHPDFRVVRGYEKFANQYAGSTFGDGAYRFHDSVSGPRGQGIMDGIFPGGRGSSRVFAYDWMGRQLAVDFDRLRKGDPLLLLIDPEEGGYELPFTFTELHSRMIFDKAEPLLEISLFRERIELHPGDAPLAPENCLGMVQPAALGGDPMDVGNRHVTPIEVHWELTAQLVASAAGISQGTGIGSVSGDSKGEE